LSEKVDNLVKSSLILSFRAKREIFTSQRNETTRFLSSVEMTSPLDATFYGGVNIGTMNALAFSRKFLAN